MSEGDDNSQAEAPKVPTVMDPKTFFISHINSYTGKVLYEELSTSRDPMMDISQYKFRGTLESGTNHIYTPAEGSGPPDGVEKVVKMERSREFREAILESDVIIYDLMTNDYKEVDYVIKTLKTSKLTSKKTLIILSSVLTWVNTLPKLEKEGEEQEGDGEGGGEGEEDPEADGGEEEPDSDEQPAAEDGDGEEKPKPPKVLFFKEADNHLRVPHERFLHHKNLETLAMSAPKTQPLLKVHIMCTGIRYGHGEGAFYDHFKNAWVQTPRKLQIIGDGKNFIPTIHIRDLARATKTIIDDDIEKDYIFAVDRTKRPTQKRIIRAISSGIGTGLTQHLDADEIADSIIWKDFLTINLKMKASAVFRDKEPGEGEDLEDPAVAAKYKFPWHCENGIIENAKQLNLEFNEARELKPVKIFVTGAPASGKTFYSDAINGYYNIPRVHVKELTDKAFALAKSAGDDEEGAGEDGNAMGAAIKEVVDTMRAAAAEAEVQRIKDDAAARGIELEDEPEVDPESLPVRLPNQGILYDLLRARLNENDCRNRGYILDGFPRTYEDCQWIFLKKQIKYDPETGEPVDDEDIELAEGEKKKFDDYILDESISASSCIILKQTDDFLVDRVLNLGESAVEGTHYNAAAMKRRLQQYHEANESQIAEPSVQQFFKEHQVPLFEKDASVPVEQVMDSIKVYIERSGIPRNFMHADASHEATRRLQVEKGQQVREEQERLKIIIEEGVEKELKKMKEAQIKANLSAIKEDQNEQLDQKSQPIRHYMMDNLVPILTEGLIDVCKR